MGHGDRAAAGDAGQSAVSLDFVIMAVKLIPGLMPE
jgi:hypothetical protein